MSTVGQTLRLVGTKTLLNVEGVLVEADNVQRFKVLIRDVPQEPEPFQNIQAQTRSFVELTCLASAVNKPREIKVMIELPAGRTFNTLRLLPTEDPDHVTWFCEVERK